MAKKFRALGAYIFAGGFTLGVKQHFDVDTHFEDGPYGTDTSLYNKVVRHCFIDPAAWPVDEYRGEIDFVYANPACAPWSMASAGRDLHWTADPRVNMVRRTFGLLDSIDPDVWAWESVRPTFIKGRALVNEVAAEGNRRGYHATVLMVDGQYHGVAQERRRMFVVLSRFVLPWSPGDYLNPVTVRQAFKGGFKTETFLDARSKCEPLSMVKKMKQGERFQAAFDRANPGMKKPGIVCKGRPGFLKFRLAWDEPSRVLLGGAHLFHPDKHRYITVEEAAALCGYPRGYKFIGGLSKQYAQVAQAVMPPTAEYLARIVRRGLEQKRKITKPGYERVEIFGDRIEQEQLDQVLRMRGGLKLVAEAPKKPSKAPKIDAKTGVVATQQRGHGIGAYIRELLQAPVGPKGSLGYGTNDIIAMVRKKFPESKATAADVSWNRRKLAGKE